MDVPDREDERREGPVPVPGEFQFDVHPAVRAAAARVRVTVDAQRGRETPQWIVDLSKTRPPV